jgi:hypothetical protein
VNDLLEYADLNENGLEIPSRTSGMCSGKVAHDVRVLGSRSKASLFLYVAFRFCVGARESIRVSISFGIFLAQELPLLSFRLF